MKQLVLTIIEEGNNLKITKRNEGFNHFEVLGFHFCEALYEG